MPAFREFRILLSGYVVVAVLAGWPVAFVVIAGAIASRNGCTLHEGFVNPCVVNGRDIGGTLYTMSGMGWFMLATIPIGALALIAWTVGWIVWMVMRRRKA